MLIFGAAIGFSDPKTISSKGAARLRPDGTVNFESTGHGNFPAGALQEFAPTVMVGVPKIWDILKKGVESVISKSNTLVNFLFFASFAGENFQDRQITTGKK